MAKPFPKFGPYNIIADTNALRAQDSRKLVSAGFEAALAELRKLTTIQLYVPDVVIGEMAYQKFEMASAAIEAINSKLNLLGEITGGRKPTVCSVAQARKIIQKRYSTWCKTNSARRFVSKVRQANWNRIVEDAVWRISPFEPSEDRKHEKGFRDRVVLEAVTQLCSNTTNETILLTEDGLLSKAVIGCGLKSLTIVPRLEDFTSRVRLLKEKETKEWIETLFAEATRTFYAKDKSDCLYWKEKIHEQIAARLEDLLPPPGDPLMSLFEPKAWERQTEDRITLGTTQYEKRVADRYQWKTDVKSAAAFSGKAFLDMIQEKIRISTFAAHWSSQANSDAEIRDAKFENIRLAGRQMILDTAEARVQWALPAKPVPATPALFSLEELLKGLPSTTAK
jgi:hypothetical protein